MIGGIKDLFDLRDILMNRLLHARLQCNGGHPAPLAAATHFNINRIALYIQKRYLASVSGHRRIDLHVQNALHLHPNLLFEVPRNASNRLRKVGRLANQMLPNNLPNLFSDPTPIGARGGGNDHPIPRKLDRADAVDLKKLCGQWIFFRLPLILKLEGSTG